MIRRNQPEKGFRKRCSAASSTRNPKNFSSFQRKTDVIKGALFAKQNPRPAKFQLDQCRGVVSPPEHPARSCAWSRTQHQNLSRPLSYILAIAKDKNLFTYFKHFCQLVANKHNGNAVILELADNAKKSLHLTPCQSCCGLVHNNKTRVGRQTSADRNQLLVSDRYVFYPGVEIDLDANAVQPLLARFFGSNLYQKGVVCR